MRRAKQTMVLLAARYWYWRRWASGVAGASETPYVVVAKHLSALRAACAASQVAGEIRYMEYLALELCTSCAEPRVHLLRRARIGCVQAVCILSGMRHHVRGERRGQR